MIEGYTPLPEKMPDIPEEAVSKGLVAFLKYLHAEGNLRPVGLRKHIASAGNGTLHNELTGFSDKDSRVIEANAIGAHLITQIWPKMHVWMQANPGQVGQAVDMHASTLADVPETTLAQRFLVNPNAGFGDLRKYAIDTCQHFVNKEVSGALDRGDPAASRLRSIMLDPFYKSYQNDPAMFVVSGFVTANDTIWGILNSIHHVYRKQYGEEPTREMYHKLALSGKDLALTIATAQLGVFSVFRGHVEGDDYNRYISRLFLNGLAIVGDKDTSRLDFTPDVLRAIGKEYLSKIGDYQPVARTGCPALVAPGIEGPNVISEYFDWAQELGEKYYLPMLEK